MIPVILFSLLLEQSVGTPIANVWLSPIKHITPIRQFHEQDGSGAYHYSLTGPHQAKTELNSNGIAYSVIQDTLETEAAKKSRLDELINSILKDTLILPSNILPNKYVPPYFALSQLPKDSQKNSVIQDTAVVKNPHILPELEVDGIQVPIPDPSLSNISPTSSSLDIATQSENQKGDRQLSQQNALQLGKLVSLNSVQRPLAGPGSYVLPVLPYRLLHSSLHHTQDSLGQYEYSYTGDTSAKTESRSLDGTTRGAYSYIDPNGILQQVHYVADHNGFRVLATNLPEAN